MEFGPVDISDRNVNERRQRVEPVFGRAIHEYVPLYFRAKNPMLYRRRELQRDLAVLYITLTVVDEPNVLFTDGNAASRQTKFYDDFDKLSELDLQVLNDDRWDHHENGKRRRCAEVLVPNAIQFENVSRIVVQNEIADQKVGKALAESGTICERRVEPSYFFP